MKFHIPVLFAALLFAAPAVHAQVNIEDAWVRATVQEQKTTGAFMKITSPVDAQLVEVRSALTKQVEIHEMAMVDGMDDTMQMRQIFSLDLPADTTVELKPGGYHVMLFDLARQIKEGDIVPLTLVIEAGAELEIVEVNAVARPLHRPAH